MFCLTSSVQNGSVLKRRYNQNNSGLGKQRRELVLRCLFMMNALENILCSKHVSHIKVLVKGIY